MPFNTYYQEELLFLRDMGTAFAQAYPRLAPFLAREGTDPDVERLLEGFAFLTGRLRQKVDDELPELTHALIALLWPHFLRPLPAMSMLCFEPIPHLVSEKQRIPRGTTVDAMPVEGTSCRFQTCYDVDLYPLTLEAVVRPRESGVRQLTLQFRCTSARVSPATLGLDTLRLYLHGELFLCQTLYLWLCQYVDTIVVQQADNAALRGPGTAPPAAIRAVGFAEDEGLLPYPANAFLGYRLLQEYFMLPRKFLFVEITGLAPHLARLDATDRFELTCTFSRPLEERVRPTTNDISLYCTPVVNLFPHDADPIRLDHSQVQYHVRPSGHPPEHFEIYSIDEVVGWVQGSGMRRVYQPFLSFDRQSLNDDQTIYYRTRLEASVLGRGADTFMAFVTPGETQALPDTEIISLTLTCTNRHLPEQLRPGDITVPTENSPTFARFRNIDGVTPSLLPPLDQGLHWQLISNMALHYSSLMNVAALRRILSTYNFFKDHDLQAEREHALRMEAMQAIRTVPVERFLKLPGFQGAPVRGLRIELDLQGKAFTSEGDLYLFATILREFFALYATINSFHKLVVRNLDRGEVYTWPDTIGLQTLL